MLLLGFIGVFSLHKWKIRWGLGLAPSKVFHTKDQQFHVCYTQLDRIWFNLIFPRIPKIKNGLTNNFEKVISTHLCWNPLTQFPLLFHQLDKSIKFICTTHHSTIVHHVTMRKLSWKLIISLSLLFINHQCLVRTFLVIFGDNTCHYLPQ